MAYDHPLSDRERKKRALLAMRARFADPHGADPAIPHPHWTGAGEPHRPFPLTELQAAYFVAKHVPEADPVGCHMYLEFRLDGLKIDRLEQAWKRLLLLHPMLRARVDSNGTQTIPEETPLFAIVHYEAVRSEAMEQHLETIRSEMSHKVYRAGTWPLFDIRVTSSPSMPSRVHVSMDGWIVDGASADLLYRQWRLLYEEPDTPLAAPVATFRDYVLSMKASETGEAYRRCAVYWAEKLRVLPAPARLPYRPAKPNGLPGGQRRRLHWTCATKDWERAKAALRAADLSPSAAMLAIFIEQLRELGGNDQFSLVATLRNRPRLHPEIDQIVGPFSSTSIFLAEHRPDASFIDEVRHCQRQLWRDIDHAHIGGVSALRLAAAGAPVEPIPVVFTSTLGFSRPSLPAPSFLDEVDYAVSQTPGIDLHCRVDERGNGLHITWDFAWERLDSGIVEAMFELACACVSVLASEGLIEDERQLGARPIAEARRLLIKAVQSSGSDDVPMTPLQQAYLARRLSDPTLAAAAVYREFELPLGEPEGVQRALNAIIAGSEVLRSPARAEKGRFIRFSNAYCPVPVSDLRGLPEHEHASRLIEQRLKMREILQGGRVWPPLAAHVALIAGGKARLQIALDSIVFDGHGSWQFYRELFRRCTEHDFAISEATSPFEDYARARDLYRASGAFAADQLYWARKFEALSAGPQWPWPAGDAAGPSERYTLAFDAWLAVKEGARRLKLPPAAVLVSLYVEVLRRWSRCSRPSVIVAHYPQRNLLPGLAECYGDFSTLCWVAGGDPASTLETSARDVADALACDSRHDWGDPFEVLRRLGTGQPSPMSFPAVFTTCLGVNTEFGPGIAECDAEASTPGVDIDVMAVESCDELRLFWQINVARIPRVIATSMLREYRFMLSELSAGPAAWDAPIGALGSHALLRTRRGRAGSLHNSAFITHAFNDTDAEYGRDQCLHQLFERQASNVPERIALISDDELVTYGELERRSNRLARFLQRQGIRKGGHVAVLLDHSVNMIVSLLAILKAGAAYVPLNLSDPPRRIVSILERADVCATISTSAHLDLLGAQKGVLLLDSDRQQFDGQADTPPPLDCRSEDTAYVIFTSGTTSEPKGVVVQHRPVINLIDWAAKTFEFCADDRVILVNSLAFDLSVFDIFGMLAYGASIRLVSHEQRLDPVKVAHLLLHDGITFWNSAPAYLKFVMPSLKRPRQGDAHLRLAFLSGDRISPGLPTELRTVFPDTKIIALGGSTEATVWSNYFPVGDIDPSWTSVPYGRPIQNARYYILDDGLEPCRNGMRGRLYIGGECLSAGYFNAEELTRRRFLSDPFHERPGMTMFDTGDLASVMEDGNIEFLGRADDQVKIRGFRVGLGEIEAALARCGVVDPVAVVRKEGSGDPQIVAFGVSATKPGPLADTVFWRSLGEHLPTYMIPMFVHLLPSLPMTRNGKIDRRALAQGTVLGEDIVTVDGAEAASEAPAKDQGRQVNGDATDRLARFLCSALAETLGVPAESIRLDSHFSTLGVSSLQFSVLSTALSEASGALISPAKLFRCTSIGEMVGAIATMYPNALAGFAHRESAAIETAGFARPEPLSPHPVLARDGECAIVGIHCIMPKADGPDAFWRNLVHGRDCVEAIPKERWNWRAFYGDPRRESNVSLANKAAFMTDVDMFDAAFFGISPREAELMDPRQRLLLQGAWRAIENAGYRPSALSGQPIGVFIGATGDEYAALLDKVGHPTDQFSLTGGGRSFIANRLSYLFGWRGPSEVIDATCSSSAVAVHNAVCAIRHGDCAMALAGGINIMIDPRPHLSLSRIGVLSPDGVCRTFDAHANGYVRGEGVGLLLIKPLAQAVSDGDHIHAVISGTAVNHGGRANSMTAPNPRAQAEVIVKAFRRASVEPQQVGYIETHGTGTVLGDPIEIEGIKEAFTALFAERGGSLADAAPIGLGSVKSSIGHLEAAAGVAGVIKAVLMLRNATLPPLVHLTNVNPQIDLQNTPFFFQTAPAEWAAPSDAAGRPLPRAVGVSAFGIGGVNAHVVMREHFAEPSPETQDSQVVLVPLSARSREHLVESAVLLRDALRGGVAPRLIDVAFTLANGREAFDERVAIFAESIADLVKALDGIAGGRIPDSVWFGSARKGQRGPSIQAADKGDRLPVRQRALTCAREWLSGGPLDWCDFYGAGRRVPLPGHPFARTSHWVPALRVRPAFPPFPELIESADAARTGFFVQLIGDEQVIADHQIGGMRVVPAAAYLVLAQAIAQRLYPSRPVRIKAMTWMRALRIIDERPLRLQIAVVPRHQMCNLSFVVESDGASLEYASALVEARAQCDVMPALDIESLKRRATGRYSTETCYGRLAECGIEHGPSLRVVRELWWWETGALAYLALPNAAGNSHASWHPALLDGALQTMLLHHLSERAEGMPAFVPFSVGEIVPHVTLPAECYVHVALTRQNIGPKALREYEVRLIDPAGDVLLELRRCMGVPSDTAVADQNLGCVQLFRERWDRATTSPSTFSADRAQLCHVTLGLSRFADTLNSAGERVLANAILPPGSSGALGVGSALPWESLLSGAIMAQDVMLWYDQAAVAAMPVENQLRFGFDTVLELVKHLIATPAVGRCRIVLNIIGEDGAGDQPGLAALAGFARVVKQESSHLSLRIVQWPGTNDEMAARSCPSLLKWLASLLDTDEGCVEHRIDLGSGAHEIRGLEPVDVLGPAGALPVAPSGLYLVTGGLGRIGQHLARALLARGASVALLGRSPPDGRADALIAGAASGTIAYYQGDVTDRAALLRILARIRSEQGPIRGVLHCAGEARPGLLRFKTLETARQVLSAKVIGAACLDEATRTDALDFFVLFSSLASITGPPGAADYAYASRYIDLFAAYRNSLAGRGLRRGHAIAVGWPVWSDGGIRLAKQEIDYLRGRGLELIDSARGTDVLARCMTKGGGHYLCGYGDPRKYEPFLRAGYKQAAALPRRKPTSDPATGGRNATA
ncbi:non-ribosomal peptide synthetase [Bradyrhizobium elkanii]|uniref:non-ribosomal peptide synthetase n=1 Tax=Bradyrhizobium elkanii TaxID=29448 RepID=UPI001BAE555E|nr:non-ribosomal peptide synthetase [Bradyrhizobium elkanii]MBR1158092.1 amino acid adenylation domain-containing protein [Bradyrhizobium elkanii]